MIVRMKKVTILCTAGSRGETLDVLRDLGVLHVEHVRPPAGGVFTITASTAAEHGAAISNSNRHIQAGIVRSPSSASAGAPASSAAPRHRALI